MDVDEETGPDGVLDASTTDLDGVLDGLVHPAMRSATRRDAAKTPNLRDLSARSMAEGRPAVPRVTGSNEVERARSTGHGHPPRTRPRADLAP